MFIELQHLTTMNKLYLLLIVTIFGIQRLHAQDLIVTTKGDSINCHITLKTFENIRFRVKHENETRLTALPLDEISSYQYNFYPGTVIKKVKKIRNHDYQHWRLAANAGVSQHVARTAPNLSYEENQQAEGLKRGKNLGAECHYFLSEPFGIGIKYVNFHSMADYSTQTYVSSAKLSIHFIGPGAIYRLKNAGGKNAFLFNLSPGYVDYQLNKSYHGKNVGWMGGISYDRKISDLFSLGLQLSYLSCQLKEIEFTSADNYKYTYKLRKGSYESLHRLDFSVGFRFNL